MAISRHETCSDMGFGNAPTSKWAQASHLHHHHHQMHSSCRRLEGDYIGDIFYFKKKKNFLRGEIE